MILGKIKKNNEAVGKSLRRVNSLMINGII